jgi:hypothetical protein
MIKRVQLVFHLCKFFKYEGRLKSTWTSGSAPLLCRGRW